MTALRTFSLILMACFGLSVHASDEPRNALAGVWQSHSASGISTQLNIQANGKFVLRQEHSSDPRRDYLCGTLRDTGDALVLTVGAKKERLANGQIEQMVGTQTLSLPVHQRSSQTLIIDYKDRTIVLTSGPAVRAAQAETPRPTR